MVILTDLATNIIVLSIAIGLGLGLIIFLVAGFGWMATRWFLQEEVAGEQKPPRGTGGTPEGV